MEENVYFECREEELAWLKRRDKRLGAVIEQVGQVKREVIPDFFMAVVHSIVGQQIYSKAHATVWRRICEAVSPLTPQRVADMQSGSRRIGKHIQYIEFRAFRIDVHPVGFPFDPAFPPFLFDFSEIILHNRTLFILCFSLSSDIFPRSRIRRSVSTGLAFPDR